jgi:hypothetical protein
MDYLLQNPEKQSGKQKTKYEFEEITEENRNMAAVGYQKPESFYKIFLSMQILYDYIESMKGDNVKLDRIGFRSPGSLTNIIFLIKQLYEIQVESCQNPVKTYIRLYFWFLENEINRCLKIFNQFSEYKIRTIEVHKIDQSIAERNDRKYMNNLMQKFKYESVSPKS